MSNNYKVQTGEWTSKNFLSGQPKMICGGISEHGYFSYFNPSHHSHLHGKQQFLRLHYKFPQIEGYPLPNPSPYSTPFTQFRNTRLGCCGSRSFNDGFALASTELSFYELLGISESGSFSEIKQAYKQLVLKYHPDVSPEDKTQEYTTRFIQVQEAYETLSDPTRRALYDRDLSKGLHLAFSSRRKCHHSYNDEDELMEKTEWKNNWQAQVSELKGKSAMKDTGNLSWAAQMRKRREKLIDK